MTFVLTTKHRSKISIPNRRFWWIIKLCRALLKCFEKNSFDETWEKYTDRKDGTQEYEFFIRVVLPVKKKPKDGQGGG